MPNHRPVEPGELSRFFSRPENLRLCHRIGVFQNLFPPN